MMNSLSEILLNSSQIWIESLQSTRNPSIAFTSAVTGSRPVQKGTLGVQRFKCFYVVCHVLLFVSWHAIIAGKNRLPCYLYVYIYVCMYVYVYAPQKVLKCIIQSKRTSDVHASVNYVNIDSGNGLLPVRHQAITWIIADLLSKGPL